MASTINIEMLQLPPESTTVLQPPGLRPSSLSGTSELEGGRGSDQGEGWAERSGEAIPSGPDPGESPAVVIGSTKAPRTRTKLLPMAWTPPSYDELVEQRKGLFTAEEKEQAWNEVNQIVKTYSDDMVERWNLEIDTYLVYVRLHSRPLRLMTLMTLTGGIQQAGLFSAIVTAFNVQSYLSLQQTADPTLAAILQISLQLSSLSINPPFDGQYARAARLRRRP
ncbi:hypothetical protein BV20DRAFT_149734 [Pilatotrama ljubarskyi]|nr:hypothetical protein BV20DRAFT_149734 [Pilatotrama ljubarskyi]